MRMTFSRYLLAALLLLLCIAHETQAAGKEEESLAALQRQNVGLTSIASTFTQTTTIPMFEDPIVSSGRFLYQKPSSLRWEYLTPVPHGFVLNGDRGFKWEDETRTRTNFTVNSDPAAGLVAAQLLTWVTFDIASIRAEYSVTVIQPSPLHIVLEPLRPETRKVVASLDMLFSPRGTVEVLVLVEASGGQTRLTFTDTRVNTPLDAVDFDKP